MLLVEVYNRMYPQININIKTRFQHRNILQTFVNWLINTNLDKFFTAYIRNVLRMYINKK